MKLNKQQILEKYLGKRVEITLFDGDVLRGELCETEYLGKNSYTTKNPHSYISFKISHITKKGDRRNINMAKFTHEDLEKYLGKKVEVKLEFKNEYVTGIITKGKFDEYNLTNGSGFYWFKLCVIKEIKEIGTEEVKSKMTIKDVEKFLIDNFMEEVGNTKYIEIPNLNLCGYRVNIK